MVKIEMTTQAANELVGILAGADNDIRGRKNPPKGMTTAEAWDRLEAIKEIGKLLNASGVDNAMAALHADIIIEHAELG